MKPRPASGPAKTAARMGALHGCALFLAAIAIAVPPPARAGHVPPAPPQHPLPEMTYRQMAALMQMDDTERFGKVLLEQLEWRDAHEGNAVSWDAEGWYGGDYSKLWLKTEGERVAGATGARAELLWDRVVSRWWSLQAGARQDFGRGPPRTWAALGVQGLAPYWFNVEATFYLGEAGRTAARLETDYDLLLTQRLIVQPELRIDAYGKSDPGRGLGSGVSNLELAVRARYEIRRELAPYLGLVWTRRLGATADLARSTGERASDVQLVAGLRLWF